MLPAVHRLRSPRDFTAVTRRGRRTRCGGLVVYLLDSDRTLAPRVGLIVGKAVGGSVQRHQVSRRLRAQLSARVNRLPAGADLVVRALPGTAEVASPAFGHDLDRALAKLVGR